MKNLTTSWVTVPFAAALLSFGALSFGAVAPASAQVGGGLVVVNLTDVIDDISVDLSGASAKAMR
jgi:hypothetical protein